MLDQKQISELIKNKNTEELLLIFEDYNVVSMSEIVEPMATEDILFLLKFLPKNIGGDLFANFDSKRKGEIIESLSDEDVKNIFNNFYSDDIINLLGELPANLTKRILESASKETREDINTLLDYKEETAGAIMTVEFVELKANDTYKDALEKVKFQGPMAEVVTETFIVNANRVLQGKIPLRNLIFGKDEEIVANKMETNIITVATQADQEDVLIIMQKYDLHVIPVVNADYCLVGIITIDDILDVMEREVTEDVHQMAGISKTDGSYINTSIWEMVKARTPWLMVLMFTALFSEFILKTFNSELQVATILAAFIPMVMGTAGNAANQSSVMVIRGIVTEGLNVKDASKIFLKEVSVSFYLSIVMFVVAALRVFLLPPAAGLDVMLSISITIVVSIFVANIIGGLLPLVALYFDKDPSAVAAPIVSNIMDVSSLAIYFLIAKVILGI